MRILKDLVVAASKDRAVNDIRYMLALREIGRGDGSVDVNSAVRELAAKFGVKPKTILNRLYNCANKGYGNFNPSGTRFYYYSQERLLQALGYPLTTKTSIRIDDLSGSVVQIRARFHAALMAAHNPNMTITRKSIQSLSGKAKRTQRKYEKLGGTKVTSNFARLAPYTGHKTDLDRIRYLGHAAFVSRDAANNHYIVKQLANTYQTSKDFRKSSRKVKKQPCIHVGGGNAKTTKVFYDNLKAGLDAWDETRVEDIYAWNSTDGIWEWIIGNYSWSEWTP